MHTRLKNFYADHDGILDTSLLDTFGTASRKTSFEAPLIKGSPSMAGVETGGIQKCVVYTNNNVIAAIEKIARNLDDRVGFDIGKYIGETTIKGIPFRYNEIFDTASTYLYGSDPIVGINFEQMYPVTSLYFESTTQKMPYTSTGMMEIVDLVWAAAHCKSPQMAGFMISEHT